MPQGHRSVPFSGKAKRLQLQQKRGRKKDSSSECSLAQTSKRNQDVLISKPEDGRSGADEFIGQARKINFQSGIHKKGTEANRYFLHLREETKEELTKKKEDARRPIDRLEEQHLELSDSDIFPEGLEFPKRPPWNFNMSHQELDLEENAYFREYLQETQRKFASDNLSCFEMNLETWRQLWRVLEMSDIILIVLDIRFPSILLPPSLYNHITKELMKDIIVVLNKIDLAPVELVVAWKSCIQKSYPNVKIVMFTSFPTYNIRGNQEMKGLQIRRMKGRLRMSFEGALRLHDACKDIVKDKVDLTSWHQKIVQEMQNAGEESELDVGQVIDLKKTDTSAIQHERFKDGILTIGSVGHPNVGKSSLINTIMGKKVVSVSRTPGHTKHFQTIFITPTVKLCDCPGLIFPSRLSKELQVLMGSYPIAQLKEPYSTIRYLAERVSLPTLLRIQQPGAGDTDGSHPDIQDQWSAMDICEAWAEKRGFRTARAARPDTYRAANHILRMALEGKISLCMYPPGYTNSKDDWKCHPDVKEVFTIRGMHEAAANTASDATSDAHDNWMDVEENSESSDGDGGDGDDDMQGGDQFESCDDEQPSLAGIPVEKTGFGNLSTCRN